MACYNACHFGAISIVENSISAKVPQVNVEQCKNCGLCEKVCPVINAPVLNSPQKAYALYLNDNAYRRNCASGGAATAFSKEIINREGVVYGATSYGGYPKFIRVSTLNDLELLKGSKYVYCDPGLIYAQVKKDLVAGTICLFIGTPCDVGGLLTFLRRKYDNLFTIDLVCHGTPPYAYLKKHLESKSVNIDSVGNITFRGDIDFHTTIFNHENSIIYKRNQYEDEYFAAFMKGVMFRPSCYVCSFARKERVSDITIGDFWGISKGALNNYKGKISLALINTEKGKALFENSKTSFVWEEREIMEALLGNEQLQRPSKWTQEAKTFHESYIKDGSIKNAFKSSGIESIINKNKVKRLVFFIPKLIRKLI